MRLHNHALKRIFVRHVRLGGVRATLMIRLRLIFAALTRRSASAALQPARAHSPGRSFESFLHSQIPLSAALSRLKKGEK